MSETKIDRTSRLERVEDAPRILAEMNAAVREALLRHKQLGLPVAVWRNSRVEWVQPEDIPDRLPPLTEE